MTLVHAYGAHHWLQQQFKNTRLTGQYRRKLCISWIRMTPQQVLQPVWERVWSIRIIQTVAFQTATRLISPFWLSDKRKRGIAIFFVHDFTNQNRWALDYWYYAVMGVLWVSWWVKKANSARN